ncbi:hypothetical protein ACW9KT_09595 [Hymenobacter sp. HD11105]
MSFVTARVISRDAFSFYATEPAQTVLTRRHRTWVALYALAAGQSPRAEVLRANEVTEADLVEFEESWRQLRRRNFPPLN